MFSLAQLQLDHVVGNGGQPSFGDLLAVSHAVADVGAPADEAAVLIEGAQRTLGAWRRGFELITWGKWIGLVEQRAQPPTHPFAVIEPHPRRPARAGSEPRR